MISKEENNSFIAKFSFQDFFKTDTISLRINNCEIFKDIIVTSSDVGYTKLSVELYDDDQKSSALYFNKYIYCDKVNPININIEIDLNNKMENFTINTLKGKYIGFDKKGNKISIIQSKLPFEYD